MREMVPWAVCRCGQDRCGFYGRLLVPKVLTKGGKTVRVCDAAARAAANAPAAASLRDVAACRGGGHRRRAAGGGPYTLAACGGDGAPLLFSSPSPPRVTHPSTWQEWERSAEAMSARGDRLGESEWHAIQTLEVTCLIRKDAILMRRDAILIWKNARTFERTGNALARAPYHT